MSYQITDLSGITSLLPSHQRMVEIVKELHTGTDHRFGEVTLTHDSGVAISLYSNGSAVMDTPDAENYCLLESLSQNDQLMLWVQLAAGNVASLNKLDWKAQ